MKQRSFSSRRRRSTPEERRHWAERFYKSGLSQSEFASQHGIGLSTLQRWLNQNSSAHLAPAFAEVKLPPLTARWAAELVDPEGRVLRLAHDVPAALLEQLLAPC